MTQKRRILLVDDDLFMRELLTQELAEHGYSVVIAEQGVQAMEVIGANPVDGVITDLIMPDMDGIELIQALRRRYPDLPIIALSGGSQLGNITDYLGFATGLGANKAFAKPLKIAELIQTLEQYWQDNSGTTQREKI